LSRQTRAFSTISGGMRAVSSRWMNDAMLCDNDAMFASRLLLTASRDV